MSGTTFANNRNRGIADLPISGARGYVAWGISVSIRPVLSEWTDQGEKGQADLAFHQTLRLADCTSER
jgi:hypothetical protein